MFDGMKMTNLIEDCPPLYPPGTKFRKFGEGLFRKSKNDPLEEAKEDVAKDDNFYWQAFEMGDPLIFIIPGPLTEKAYWEIKLKNGIVDAYSYANVEGVAELFHNV
jgi:hypothetical protein